MIFLYSNKPTRLFFFFRLDYFKIFYLNKKKLKFFNFSLIDQTLCNFNVLKKIKIRVQLINIFSYLRFNLDHFICYLNNKFYQIIFF